MTGDSKSEPSQQPVSQKVAEFGNGLMQTTILPSQPAALDPRYEEEHQPEDRPLWNSTQHMYWSRPGSGTADILSAVVGEVGTDPHMDGTIEAV